MFVGGLILGVCIGLIIGLVAYWIGLSRLEKPAREEAELVEQQKKEIRALKRELGRY
jgi:uncharacterized membrane-anchored protein YhcB (DUF1043 family)